VVALAPVVGVLAAYGDAHAAPTGRWTEVRVTAPPRLAGGKTARGLVLVYTPAKVGPGPAPLLVVLHGWNGTADEWKRRPETAEVIALADEHGVIVAVPSLGRTVYESRFYPESRGRWGRVPGAVWLGEVVLPHLRATLPVRKDRGGTAILGNSTGGRGAVVLAQRYPEFGAVASLSGTYDLGLLPPSAGEYKIHAVVFGPRARFPERWREEDCVDRPAGDRMGARPRDAKVARLRGVTLYLAHGGADKVVGPDQLRSLEQHLGRAGVAATVVVDPAAGHDWKFWGAQLRPALTALFQALRAGAKAPQAGPPL
jgi:putative tributyrin esterase